MRVWYNLLHNANFIKRVVSLLMSRVTLVGNMNIVERKPCEIRQQMILSLMPQPTLLYSILHWWLILKCYLSYIIYIQNLLKLWKISLRSRNLDYTISLQILKSNWTIFFNIYLKVKAKKETRYYAIPLQMAESILANSAW